MRLLFHVLFNDIPSALDIFHNPRKRENAEQDRLAMGFAMAYFTTLS
jgi:hypothetical protein